jgi:hypothetical protein
MRSFGIIVLFVVNLHSLTGPRFVHEVFTMAFHHTQQITIR